jgi:hypothetical protein
MKKEKAEKVDEVLEGLTGNIRVGKKYYLFALPYHYIGVVEAVNGECIRLAARSTIVTNAGSHSNAVSNIVAGKAKPEICEESPMPIYIFRQAMSAAIPMAEQR